MNADQLSSANSLFAQKNGAVRAARTATAVLAALGLAACGEPVPPYFQGSQWLGETLPPTHFLGVVRGILLKDNGVSEVLPHLWPVALFVHVVAAIALLR